VLQKCANPACPTLFRHLDEGKLFLVESAVEDSQAILVPTRRKQPHRLEYYWLCSPCSLLFTLMFDQQRGVATAPISLRSPTNVLGGRFGKAHPSPKPPAALRAVNRKHEEMPWKS
jgi:hypothetical protein